MSRLEAFRPEPARWPSRRALLLALILSPAAGVPLLAAGCTNPAEPTTSAEFIIDVSGERFVLRTTHPPTIQAAEENLRGGNSRFPLGPLRSGNGGFNAPWSWHFDPEATRFVEVAIELCDGRPSYVEAHLPEYPTYCPWGARVVGRR
jgi:hypothetical protein